MISVKNHHITAIVRVDIDLEREDLEIKISCQMLWGNCKKPIRQVLEAKRFG